MKFEFENRITNASDQKWVSDEAAEVLRLSGTLGVSIGLTAEGVFNLGNGVAEGDISRAIIGGASVLIGAVGAIRGAGDFESHKAEL